MADTLPKIMVVESQGDWPAEHQNFSAATTVDLSLSPDGRNPARSLSPKIPEGTGTSNKANGRKSPLKLIRNVSTKDMSSSRPPSPPARRPSAAMNPLSQTILKRTNTENTIPSKLRSPVPSDPPNNDSSSIVGGESAQSGSFAPSSPARTDSNLTRDKKKGVSFLSRFSMIGSKRKDQDAGDDDDSDHEGRRTEAMHAHVFSSSIEAGGYIPQHKEPPRYIKVRAYNKKEREFDRMFLAQRLCANSSKSSKDVKAGTIPIDKPPPSPAKSGRSGSAVWAMEFSKDGKYLAVAGRDMIVRVWAVISTAEERQEHEREEEDYVRDGASERLSAPVFKGRPIREFEGHTSDVLDLSWSKNNFLLSSSMDKTVKLWHVSRSECLCTFKHKDFVTSIAFHPRDDRFFLAGSLDSTLRLWSIPDKSVAYSHQLTDLITAVAFTPDGKICMAGVLNGMCHLFETEGLKYTSQIHVRSSRGKNAKGSKITGIQAINYPPDDPEGETKLLITSNDSRIRLYNLKDKSLEMKFRGHENTCSQIHASFSDNAQWVICGSEDRRTYIWSTGPAEGDMKDKRPVEVFEAHSDIVTIGMFAPTKTKQLLGGSGDPIYDLCNPPPVTLLSRDEVPKSESKAGSDIVTDIKKPEESPAYLARSKHEDGNILITADHTGNIKVFRQDCAFQKRRNEMWETNSTFSRKLGGGMLGRSGSLLTRTSAGSHSRRASLSQASINLGNAPSDRILSWRNSVPSTVSIESSKTGVQIQPERSRSPSKQNRNSLVTPAQPSVSSPHNMASTARQQPYSGVSSRSNIAPSISTSSPPPSVRISSSTTNVSQPPTPGFSLHSASGEENPLRLDATGKSYQFWNVQAWKNQFLGVGTRDSKEKEKEKEKEKDSAAAAAIGSASGATSPPSADETHLAPYDSRNSVVSRLSSEDPSAEETTGEEEEEMICKRCDGKDFRSKKVLGKGVKLACARCGLVVD